MYNFEQFTGARGKFSINRIAINSSGGFQVSPGFYFKNNVREARSALIFFDRSNKAVALKLVSEDKVPGSFKITHRGNSATIGARSFFIAYGIDMKEVSGKYEPVQIDDAKHGAIVVLDLSKKLQ